MNTTLIPKTPVINTNFFQQRSFWWNTCSLIPSEVLFILRVVELESDEEAESKLSEFDEDNVVSLQMDWLPVNPHWLYVAELEPDTSVVSVDWDLSDI